MACNSSQDLAAMLQNLFFKISNIQYRQKVILKFNFSFFIYKSYYFIKFLVIMIFFLKKKYLLLKKKLHEKNKTKYLPVFCIRFRNKVK